MSVAALINRIHAHGIRVWEDGGQLKLKAPRGSLDEELRQQLIANKAGILAFLRSVTSTRSEARIERVDRSGCERLPLSYAQERLWFIDQLEPNSAGYSLPGAVSISGELDVRQLEESLNELIERHENLRTRFPSHGGEARQEILPAVEFLLERVDLSDVPGERQQSEAQRRCQEEASRPFDLARGPLLRGLVLKLGGQEHILLLNMHHIISDGWSIGVLVRELSEAMTARREGRASRLPALPIQYVDYSVWQRGWLQAEGRLERQLGYWVKKLSGMAESLDLPSDYRRPSVQSFAGATYEFVIPAELTGRLKGWSEKQGGTLYMGLLTVFTVLLHRYTGQEDICVGSPIANRQHAQTEGLIGMFVNTLAMRSRVTAQQTLTGLFEQVKGTCLEAYEHQDTPFEKIVDALRPQRNMSISPLFQVMLVLQNMEMGEQPGHIRPYPLSSGISKFDLTLECTESGGGLSGLLEYSTALYERGSIERLAAHFIGLCAALLESPQARLSQVRYLGEAERRQVLQEFNAVPTAVTATSAAAEGDGESARAAVCVHELFAAQAQRAAQRVAVMFGERRLSYGELYEKSTALALYLQSLGVGPDSLVGLCVERSLELLVGILGILQAGGAYVPLDPQYPQERLRHMIGDSGVRIVLTQQRLRGTLGAWVDEQTRLLTLDGEWESIAAQAAALEAAGTRLHDTVGPQHLAYVIYTSGSTGRPKGVMVEHRSVVNHNHFARAAYGTTSDDVQIQFSSINFDLFVEEVFVALASGARLIMDTLDNLLSMRSLSTLIETQGVTVLNVPTALFHQLAAADIQLSSVRTMIVGGEALMHSKARMFLEKHPGIALYNTYGPTEATIISTAVKVTPDLLRRHDFVPIGFPIANTQLYILDRNLEPQAVGIPGELHIAGAGLARGYLELPELTREKFVANPFNAGTRLYKTGDLARWLQNGNIEYLGRMDTQVKIRGFRIELGEIEACLNQHPDIEESVVVAQGEAGERQLAAFYRPTARGGMPANELRAHLQGSLPAYMIPTAFERLEQIPLTPNGKVDRRSLEQRRVSRESGERHRAARNEMERCLVALWAEVLGLEPGQVGIDDNFFELGGHSLLATQLVSKLRNRLQLELPLKALFEQPSIALLAQSLASLQPSEAIRIERVDRSGCERLPLSYAQERLWFIDQLEPNSAGYSLPGAVSISGELDVRQLEESLNELIERHENLRTRFPSHGGEARQEILPAVEFLLERVDLSDVPGERQQSEAQRRCQEEASRPFDLARGPLLRGLVLKLGGQEHILLLNMHHIISDGWSIGVLVRELSEAMTARREGRASRLPALPIQYVDYSVWQRGWLQAEGRLERQLGYWVKKLSGMAESLDLPSDYRRPSVQSFAGATYEFVIPAELTGRLKGWSEKQGGTLYMGLLTVFTVLLHRYTGQEDICVGSPIANRQHAQTEGLIGMFVNTLAMRSRVTAQQTLTGLFEQVKGTCLEAYEHQDTPFEKIVDALRPQRNMSISPLFQVMLVLQNMEMGEQPGHIRPYPLSSGISKFDLTLECTESGGGLSGLLEYSTALYERGSIERLAAHFIGLCAALLESPQARLSQVRYLGEAERRQVLQEFNAVPTAVTATSAAAEGDGESARAAVCVHELFAAQAQRAAQRVAVMFGERRLSYGELYEKSTALALYLQSLGVGPDSLVGLCVERSLELLVGILGILQAGGAYVPLDPQYPQERLRHMIGDSGVRIVLTQQRLRGTLGAWVDEQTRLLTLDGEWESIAAQAAALEAAGTRLHDTVGPQHLAYVIYTSGSTGRPKGAGVYRRGLDNLLQWYRTTLSLTSADRVLVVTSASFDLTQKNLLGPLSCGASVHLGAEPFDAGVLVRQIETAGITVMNLTPSAFYAIADADVDEGGAAAAAVIAASTGCGGRLSSLRAAMLGGEPISASRLAGLVQRYRQLRVINSYGPTECADVCAYFELGPAQLHGRAVIPIGRPVPHTRLYVLDERCEPMPLGVAAEIHVGGIGVGSGYVNRPQLTAQRFIADPFGTDSSHEMPARLYKTGDLGRWRADGTLEYLGRMDTQVKIRGFRIELGEIEACLNQHPDIEESVVVAQGSVDERRLVAFYRARGAASDPAANIPTASQLKTHLLQTLAPYMIPTAFERLEQIPLTPNGKVDRQALERRVVALESTRAYVAPRDATEAQLIMLWAEVLGLEADRIGVDDNFFELGGHSLSAVKLMATVNQRCQLLLPLAVLFEAPSIADLAVIVARRRSAAFDIVVPVQPAGRKAPMFAIPGVGGNVLSLRPLSLALGDDQPFYALQAIGLDGSTAPLTSVELTARANIEAIKRVQPTGPYTLIGHSYGGAVAYEMARMLTEEDEAVGALILLDSLAPSVWREHVVDDEAADLVEMCTLLAKLNGVTLHLDKSLLGDVPSADRVAHVIEMLKSKGFEIDAEQFRILHGVYKANTHAYRAYVPAGMAASIEVSLVKAAETRRGDPGIPADYGWSQLLPGPIRLSSADTGHFSMLETRHIEASANACRRPFVCA